MLDVQNIGTHEVGHNVGLADLDDSGDSEMTMYGYASLGETRKRTLHSGDIEGVRFLYPIPDFQLWISPFSHMVQPGNSTIYTVYVKSVAHFSGEISLVKSISPDEPTITLVLDQTILLDADETVTLTLSVTTTLSTPEEFYAINVTGTCGTLVHSTSTLLTIHSTLSLFHTHIEFWFTWYDKVNAQIDNIHFVNPSISSASINVSIAGSQVDSFSLAAGQSTYRNYPGFCNGPVHIISNQNIWCSQRVVGWNSFKETPGLPGDTASTEIHYTWYDMRGASWDAIHFLNPSQTATAYLDVYIGGLLKTSGLEIPPREARYVSYPGVMGGPVRIVSDIPIFSTQRVVGWSDFDEIVGMPSWYVFEEHWFNWYDRVGAATDNIHFVNPGSLTANIQVYIGRELKGSYTLGPGEASYVNYPGLVGGPVKVVSNQPVWCTQRIVGWNGFKEEFSVPKEAMVKKWFFNWYDKVSMVCDNIHFLNSGASDAHVNVTIAGAPYGPYTVPAGGAYYICCPGVCNGPVIVESDVPIMTSQRIVGWNSFEETLGVPWS